MALIGGLVAGAACLVTLVDPPEYTSPESLDADSDGSDDSMSGSPGSGQEPGYVVVTSGVGGGLLVSFVSTSPGTMFGYSAAVLNDVNLDGYEDVIVGAPLDGFGAAYVFFGPFVSNQPLEISDVDADMILFSPVLEGFDFGSSVGEVGDFDGDGASDIRVLGWSLDSQQMPVENTIVFSGLTGEPRFIITGRAPFDPWMSFGSLGDADGDADVDLDDLERVLTNYGLLDVDGNPFVGNFNDDELVDDLDLDIVSMNLGFNGFQFFFNFEIPSNGGEWVEGCDGLPTWLPHNVELRCPNGGGAGGIPGWPEYWPTPPPGTPRPPFLPPGNPPDWYPPGQEPEWPRQPPPKCGDAFIALTSTETLWRFASNDQPPPRWVERRYSRVGKQTQLSCYTEGFQPQWSFDWSVAAPPDGIEYPAGGEPGVWRGPYLIYTPLKAGDFEVRVSYTLGGCTMSDSWSFRVIHTDLDVDSLNTRGFLPPLRSAAEEAVEQDPFDLRYGKIVITSTFDSDGAASPTSPTGSTGTAFRGMTTMRRERRHGSIRSWSRSRGSTITRSSNTTSTTSPPRPPSWLRRTRHTTNGIVGSDSGSGSATLRFSGTRPMPTKAGTTSPTIDGVGSSGLIR